LAGFSDLVPVSYQMKLLFIIRNRKPPQFQWSVKDWFIIFY
jgi:hypothetical protein